MTIEFKRGHWILFGFLLLSQFLGWWMTLTRIPDRDSVFHVLQRLPWFLWLDILGGIVCPCFLTTVIVGQLITIVQRQR